MRMIMYYMKITLINLIYLDILYILISERIVQENNENVRTIKELIKRSGHVNWIKIKKISQSLYIFTNSFWMKS